MSAGEPSYAFRVQGHLDDHWAAWLGIVSVTHDDDGTSTIVATIADQATLHGVLARLRDLGVTLIAVTQATPPPPHAAPTEKR
jgi:hypothetical protein